MHQARCLAELGERAEAIRIAVSVQDLPRLQPDDVTAAAIAGSGASLVFQVSDLFEGDIAATITAGDTETSWWRGQTMSWGLSSVFEESFREWTRNDRAIRFSNDSPSYRLRGISLVDGFTARHDSWCYTVSLIAKWELMSSKLDTEKASSYLTDLRRVGDTKGVKAAVKHLLEAGPASAVRRSADQIDLDHITHTEVNASVDLLVQGADVLSTSAADQAARWAMQGPESLSSWEQRVRPGFIVEYRRADLLRALLPAVSSTVAELVREHLVALPQLSDQGAAHAWAIAIESVPSSSWTKAQADALLSRTGDHWELERAIKSIAVRRDPSWRAVNDEKLRSGSIEALAWVGPISEVPEDAVAPLVSSLAKMIHGSLTEARRGQYRGRSVRVDPSKALVLLNTHFPSSADWETVIDLLMEPLADRHLLEEAIRSIEWNAGMIDDGIRDRLVEALSMIIEREPLTIPRFMVRDPRPSAMSALETLSPVSMASDRWVSVRDRQGRQEMIWGIARRADPADVKVLIALATDPDPRIRASVAGALSYWLIEDVASTTAIDALERLLADDGTLLARCVVGSWPDKSGKRVYPLAQVLVSHISAEVRSSARKALSDSEC